MSEAANELITELVPSTEATDPSPLTQLPIARSEAQSEASRRNGLLSRGPKTAAGKAVVRRNALKHGLAAVAIPVRDRPFIVDPKVYDELLGGLIEDQQPRTQAELVQLELLAVDMMKAAYISRLELELIEGPPADPEDVARRQDQIGMALDETPEDEAQTYLAALNKLQVLLDTGTRPEFTADELAVLVKQLWRCIATSKEILALDAELLANDEARLAAEIDDEKKVELFEEIQWRKRDLAEKQGRARRHGVRDQESLRAILLGEQGLTRRQKAEWLTTVGQRHERLSAGLRKVAAIRKEDEIERQKRVLNIVSRLPGLAVISRYQTAIRRNADRTLKLLAEHRKVRRRTISVDSVEV